MREQNRIQAFQSHAQRLNPEVGRRVDHRGLTLMDQQDGRAHAIVARIYRTAHGAMAGKRGHSHGRAGTEHREFEDGSGSCRQSDPAHAAMLREGTSLAENIWGIGHVRG